MTSPRKRFTDDVRIGPISVLALIAILSMAVLAVLAVSTANASLVISERQANAVAESYLAETAAQDFVAGLDAEITASGNPSSAMKAVEKALPEIAQHAQEEADGQIVASAMAEGSSVKASFTCPCGRVLNIEVSVTSAGKLRIDEWAMSAVQNAAEPGGTLWTGA